MNWLVIGAGVTGLAAAKYLRHLGNNVRISEAKSIDAEQKSELVTLGIDVLDGGHDEKHLEGIDKVLPSPGLPAHHPLLVAAQDRSLPLQSEVDLALRDYSGKLFGVTGTNGKSTIASMMAHIIQSLGEPCALVGNIGRPPTELLREGSLPAYVVAELSSYQLAQSSELNVNIGIFSNIADDHLLYHGTRREYFEAKWGLFKRMRPTDIAIMTAEVVAEAAQYNLSTSAKTWALVDKEPSEFEFALLNGNLVIGNHPPLPMTAAKQMFPHNELNAAIAVMAIGKGLDYPRGPLIEALATFAGLPHRCEVIGTWSGKRVIEDSKATNVDSVLVALSGVKTPSYLLLGGQSKDEHFQSVMIHKDQIKKILTFGDAGPQIAAELQNHLPTESCGDLASAVKSLSTLMSTDPAQVLFSPGCASFDEFENFSVRGEAFQSHVRPFLD